MNPSVVGKQIENRFENLLKTQFAVSTPMFANMWADFFSSKREPVVKGPYIQLPLPFRKADDDSARTTFAPVLPDIGFSPYRHQALSFERLKHRKPTLVATGTGSGKTECFMFPILADAAAHKTEQGIRAIIIYPMNALATDQALRFAKTIQGDKALEGVRVGLYIGEDKGAKGALRYREMSRGDEAPHVITDRDTLKRNPPHILMTNYKMLDYMLIRPEELGLWQFNTKPDSKLKYVAVDELHTFDGAQAADLACLLRRLKERLQIADESLCCIGTSATLGSGEAAKKSVCRYATDIFGVKFDEDSLISEDRIRFDELQTQKVDPIFDERPTVALFEALGGSVATLQSLVTVLQKIAKHEQWGDHDLTETEIEQLIRDTCERLSALRAADKSRRFPEVKFQYWTRELARMVASLPAGAAKSHPHLEFADDLSDPDKLTDESGLEVKYEERGAKPVTAYFPVLNCNACGLTGWGALISHDQGAAEGQIKEIYEHWMNGDKMDDAVLLVPLKEDEAPPTFRTGPVKRICPVCRKMYSETTQRCSCGHEHLLRVVVQPSEAVGTNRWSIRCPKCGGDHGNLLFVGMRSATLLSNYINSLMTSTANLDKKLLTFSDNVQDTSHRAGFFAGRTWRAIFLAHLAQSLKGAAPGSRVPYVDFVRGFFSFLHERYPEDSYYFATLIPQDLKWLDAWKILTDDEPRIGRKGDRKARLGDRLPRALRILDARLQWEIAVELGLRNRFGRSLEKTRVLKLEADIPPSDDPIWIELADKVSNATEKLRCFHEKPDALCACVQAIAKEMISLGAFDEGMDQRIVIGKILAAGNIPLSKLKFEGMTEILKNLSSRSWHITAPGYQLQGSRHLDEMAALGVNTPFGLKLVSINPEWKFDLEDFLPLFDTLVDVGILDTVERSGVARYWFIPTERLSVVVSEANAIEALSPIREQYLAGDLIRLNAEEHTGLLGRDRREGLEKRFKDKAKFPDRKPWLPNLISATPTLEMGVDIGDLSSVLLCSVPPNASKFIQRIGRSGRTNGSALNITVANAKPHDLYFFHDPKEMIAGVVTSPGVFLKAAAILQRQYFGFALGEWLISKGNPVYPKNVGRMLKDLEEGVPGAFPNNFFAWYGDSKDELFERFINRLRWENTQGGWDKPTYDALCAFATGNKEDGTSLVHHVADAVANTMTISKSYESRQSDLVLMKRKVKKDPGLTEETRQERLEDLDTEIKSFRVLLANMRKEQVVAWLCDEAMLLPNYAFPEPGINLQSILWRKEGENPPVYEKIRVPRPASAGLRELVPGETFFTHGYHVKIDQVDLAQYTESELSGSFWRFCPDCDHVEIVKDNTPSTCPRCGADWSNVSQVKKVLPARQFITIQAAKGAINTDTNDNREPKRYDCRKFFELNRELGGYRHFKADKEGETFAFEYVPHLTMREINFGLHGRNPNGSSTKANDKDVTGQGFSVCNSCGKAVPRLGNGNAPKHVKNCKIVLGSDENEESRTGVFETSFYREYNTEAIRIFVPFIAQDDSVEVRSFMAAIEAGLKSYFKGEVDHLAMEVQSLPIKGLDFRRFYIILYDAVPGGTGYLRQFTERKAKIIFDIFQSALDVLKNCSCAKDDDRDGCYHCIYRYRNQHGRESLSRRAAVRMLEDLLPLRDTIVEVDPDGSEAGSDITSLLGSQLERLFVDRLRSTIKAAGGEFVETNVSNYTKGYRFSIPGDKFNAQNLGGDVSSKNWEIMLQKHLGGSEGVLKDSRPDFLIQEDCPSVARKAKPVAVFLDGWEYHQNSVAEDILKRMALKAAGYRVWSLDWDNTASPSERQTVPDVPAWRAALCSPKTVPNSHALMRNVLGQKFWGADVRLRAENWLKHYLEKRQEIDRLIAYLAVADDDLFVEHALFEGAVMMFDAAEKASSAVLYDLPNAFSDFMTGTQLKVVDSGFVAGLVAGADFVRPGFRRMSLAAKLEDTDAPAQQAWQAFFALFNDFQFLNDNLLVYSDKSKADDLWQLLKTSEAAVASGTDWEEAFEFARGDAFATELLSRMKASGLLVPELWADVSEDSGPVLATPWMHWPTKKVALLADCDEPALIMAGWKTVVKDATSAVEAVFEEVKGFLS